MEIPEIKSHLTIAQVLDHYGLKPNQNGMLHCPFHDDKTPSLQIYPQTNTYCCFSSNCQAGTGDVIEFIRLMEKGTKHEAILKAISMIPNNHTPPEPFDKLFKVFQANLKKSEKAQAYLKSRSLNAAAFDVGFNASTWPQLKHCVIFPLKDKSDNIVSFYGRSIYNNEDKKHYYLTGCKGLYPKYPAPETERLIITEAVIDAATLLQIKTIADQYSILAAYGTNRLTGEHKEAIKELKQLKEIIFAFDNDKAGNEAAEGYAREFKQQLPDVELTKLNLPEGEDINSVAISHQPEIFTHLLETRSAFSFSIEPIEKEKITTSKNDSVLDTRNPNNIRYTTDPSTGSGANYYIKGGISKLLDSMKVTLVVEHLISLMKSRNKVDLYEDKQVEKLCKEVAERLNIRKDLLEQDIYKLTDELDVYRESTLAAENPAEKENVIIIPAELRKELEAFGKQKLLMKRLNEMLGNSGITGEERNRIFLLCIAISHIQRETLHALIQGSSGSGKTRLLKQISSCMPPEKVEEFTRLSDKALYNYPEFYFPHKIICVEDIDGLSEEALFGLREFQTSNKLSSGVSVSLENGQIITMQKTVRGPIATLACTTHGEIYEDNMSRCFLVAVDESAEQTKRVIEYQNKKAAGQIDERQEEKSREFIQNFVRILKPYDVVNPFANEIKLPEEAHKIRRLNDLFQSFIKIVTVIHQYQRKQDNKGRLIAEIEDVEVAVAIMFESIVLKVDELDGSLRQFYEKLKEYLKKNYNGNHLKAEFTQREIRQAMHVSKTQLFRYVENLIELEYIQVSGGYSNRGFNYKISHWDNYQKLRDRIKDDLQMQVDALKQGTPEPK